MPRFTFSPDAKREGCNVQAMVRRFIFAPDRPLGLIHPIVAVLLARVIDCRGFMHGFTVCLLIWWIWERCTSANKEVSHASA